MISAVLYASDNSTKLEWFTPESLVPAPYHSMDEKLYNNTPIFNYAAFFGNGMNMYDNGLKIGDESNYYGYIGNIEEIDIRGFSEYISLLNGITVIFDRYSCKKIDVYIDGEFVKSVEDDNGLPLETFIDIEGEHYVGAVDLIFSGYPENAYVTIKGLILGKIVEIKDFFSFNSVFEIKPLGDDLPMNESNFTVLLKDNIVGESNQNMKIYDGDALYESDFLVSATEDMQNKYSFKTRSELNKLNTENSIAFDLIDAAVSDWNDEDIYASTIIDDIIPNAEYPEWFKTYRVSPFLKPQSKRKMLQQIAWATCCGIDTTEDEKIKFIPFLASEANSTNADIVIDIADSRTKSLKLTKGTKYSSVVCEIPKYLKSGESVEIGAVENISGYVEEYRASFKSDNPFVLDKVDGRNFTLYSINPYYLYVQYEYPENPKVYGYKYNKKIEDYIIDIGGFGDKLVISNQEIYPIDMTAKGEQLKKWYSNNDTIKATLVDNGDLKIGKIIDIEISSGKRFKGIITKLDRNNISDKHLIDLEAHQWN